MHLKTGDWLMLDRVKPNFIGNRIKKVTGSVHTHDELIYIDDGAPKVLCAHPPHLELIPLSDRIRQHDDNKINFAIFRWSKFVEKPVDHGMYYEAFQESAAAVIRATASLKLPYDIRSLLVIYRNYIREKLGLEAIVRKKEHHVYCTEVSSLVYSSCLVNIFKSIGFQQYPSPIHSERLYWNGDLMPVMDCGLVGNISENGLHYGYDLITEGE